MIQTLAFVFPGQGSQFVGMLSDLSAKHPIIHATFKEASDILDYDLWELSERGPAEKLNLTEFTQPALLAAGVAVWRLWTSQNKNLPAMFAGHSLGEYTALVCANSLSFSDAIRLVSLRGQLMQSAVPEGEGAMAAILGLEDAIVEAICDEARRNDVLSPANYNTVGQVVIAGHTAAVLRGMELAKARGAKRALRLPVSVPSHCALMKPAAFALDRVLQGITINAPSIPVIHNVDVALHSNPEEIHSALVEQLFKPVRWVETIQFMGSQAINTVLECGPGSVLSGLNKRITSELQCHSITLGEALCP